MEFYYRKKKLNLTIAYQTNADINVQRLRTFQFISRESPLLFKLSISLFVSSKKMRFLSFALLYSRYPRLTSFREEIFVTLLDITNVIGRPPFFSQNQAVSSMSK